MERFLRICGRGGYVTMAVLSVVISVVSYRFVPLGVTQAMEHMAHNLDGNALALYAHIGGAPLALAVMPFQFWAGLRLRRPVVHRWLGRVYVAAIFVSGVAGLQLAFHTTAGSFAGTGFGLLAVVWIATTATGLAFAVRRDFARHKAWMLRSAALTFAAVTLRLYLGIAMAFDADFETAYSLIAWACWVPNALAVEVYLRFFRAAGGRHGAGIAVAN
ncbi:DUF2306 domain-containing protein [uncultured Roseibium sp.]|uniref:DUF2306 domain-containing protein n=1 Tax=uncultured Roseibium sp. TaxID=1936171 RepID=UPI002621FCC3|nr:DUF2306 domain-containing protein [uncultured Roseibium sp.]